MADHDVQSAVTIPTSILDISNVSTASVTNQAGDKRSNPDAAGSHMTRRSRINRVKTSMRNTSTCSFSRQVNRMVTNTIHHSTCELDSHADTCVAGPNTAVLEYTDQLVNVSAFTNHMDTMKDIPIGTVATAYDNPHDGSTIILIIHQALLMQDIVDTTLLCPNQLRSHGLIVDDVPIHLSPHNQPSTHSIYIPDDDLRLPLTMVGVISALETHTPTQDELDTCRWYALTNDAYWNPHSTLFQENERVAALNPVHHDRTIYSTKTQPIIHSDLAEYQQHWTIHLYAYQH
jgi:hypothetical protein